MGKFQIHRGELALHVSDSAGIHGVAQEGDDFAGLVAMLERELRR